MLQYQTISRNTKKSQAINVVWTTLRSSGLDLLCHLEWSVCFGHPRDLQLGANTWLICTFLDGSYGMSSLHDAGENTAITGSDLLEACLTSLDADVWSLSEVLYISF